MSEPRRWLTLLRFHIADIGSDGHLRLGLMAIRHDRASDGTRVYEQNTFICLDTLRDAD